MNRLIATTNRGLESPAGSELYMLLAGLGDGEVKVSNTGIPGILTVDTSLTQIEVIDALKAILDKEPWRIRYTLRLIPIEKVVNTDLEAIVEAARPLLQKIGEGETFRVTIEKRYSDISTKEVIEALAEKVDRKVDLEDPDWIVLIEVLGGITGVSVVRPSQIVSVVKAKRDG